MKISEELQQLIAAAGRGETIEVRRDTFWLEIQKLSYLVDCHENGLPLRIKRKTITLAGVEFPEPMRAAPEIGADFWIVNLNNPECPPKFIWSDKNSYDKSWLIAGLLQGTEQGAKNQAKAMILSVGGSLE